MGHGRDEEGIPVSKCWFIMAAALVVAGLAATNLVSGARGQKRRPEIRIEFGKRITVVAMKFDPQQLTPMDGVTVKKLGDMTFLVGRVIGSINGEDWRKGTTVWIPVRDIYQLVEFDNLDQVKKVLKFTK
jgi:hypothetical protein